MEDDQVKTGSVMRLSILRCAVPAAAIVVQLAALAARCHAEQATGKQQVVWRAASLVRLAERLGQFGESLPRAADLGVRRIVAYEEHSLFGYVVGRSGSAEGASGASGAAVLQRRVVLLKPSTLVVEDFIRQPEMPDAVWSCSFRGTASQKGSGIQIELADRKIHWDVLLPRRATVRIDNDADGQTEGQSGRVSVTARGTGRPARWLHVFELGKAKDQAGVPVTRLDEQKAGWLLTVAAGGRQARLVLPHQPRGPAKIQIARADGGEVLLDQRLLPAGVLPHGSQGVRLLERWDRAYAPGRTPPWDTGRPDSQLKAAVEQGVIAPGRALEFGCGTGTNAIYLAQKGFDVTAIDLAPRALAQAERKARQAGVHVRWLLADVLSPPEDIGPFDFLLDRGCYHGVRRSDARGYVDSVRRLSRPGTRLLLLAGNANEQRHYGPPRVKEEELRGDFEKDFEFQWLRTIRFDTRDPAQQGPLGWSVLLVRKR